jgi:hypothetical protein
MRTSHNKIEGKRREGGERSIGKKEKKKKKKRKMNIYIYIRGENDKT